MPQKNSVDAAVLQCVKDNYDAVSRLCTRNLQKTQFQKNRKRAVVVSARLSNKDKARKSAAGRIAAMVGCGESKARAAIYFWRKCLAGQVPAHVQKKVETGQLPLSKALAENNGACVYFARADEWIKIGHTMQKPTQRIETVSAMFPPGITVELVGFIPTTHGPKLEKQLHKKLSQYRVRGEWFRLHISEARRVIEAYGGVQLCGGQSAITV